MNISEIVMSAAEYDRGDPKRINHFMKVYAYARTIAENENMSLDELSVLDAAAVLHDIGIHNAEQKHGSSSGKYQEMEGPPVAEELLRNEGCDEEFISAVCHLVGRHHTYTGIDSDVLQILIEADFIVNAYEDMMPKSSILSVREKLFKTQTGKKLLELLFLE